jgi:pescadillo
VSVKGVYYQAEVMGEVITWLTPHSFTQRLPSGVDFRVMITFLDFYEIFFKFVLFKLFSTLGLAYPPTVNDAMRDCGGFLLAINSGVQQPTEETEATAKGKKQPATRKLAKEKYQKLEEKLTLLGKGEEEDEEAEEGDDEDDDVDISGPLTEAFAGFQDSSANDRDGIDAEDRAVFAEGAVALNASSNGKASESNTSLFQGLCFFVSREVPLEILQICIISFGGLLGWESDCGASPIQRDDPRITHQIVDRPKLSDDVITSREYIQPQWVFDSINAQLLLPAHRYRMGAVLPPHLSPFVDDEKEGYLPTYREELKKLKSTVEVRDGSTPATRASAIVEGEESEEDEAEQYARELAAEKSGVSFSAHQQEQLEESDEEDEGDEQEGSGEDDDSEDDDDDSEEEEEEAVPVVQKKGPKGIVYDPSAGKKQKTTVASSACPASFLLLCCCFALKGITSNRVSRSDAIDRCGVWVLIVDMWRQMISKQCGVDEFLILSRQ